MKTEWDYTELADAYLKRPDYAEAAIARMLSVAGLADGAAQGARVCDVGAGVAHLTLWLARRGFAVTAIEPNDAMRANGIRRTAEFPNVAWFEGIGEDTKQEANSFRLVTFGSSFNVTDRAQSLAEAHRILQRGGYFACMWNHRDLENPLQHDIEEIIKSHVPDYSYGTRREDQTAVIDASGLFGEVVAFTGEVLHRLPAADVIEGWRSHGTVHRQAKDCFDAIMKEIEGRVHAEASSVIEIPYMTRVWMAKVKK